MPEPARSPQARSCSVTGPRPDSAVLRSRTPGVRAERLCAVLISTYEIGRQPFGVASPAAWLKAAGVDVTCQDLAVEPLDETAVAAADLIGFYVPMHTATRIACKAVPRIREINPGAHLCFFGLYATVNEGYLRKLGADTVISGEFEEPLVALAAELARRAGAEPSGDGEAEPVRGEGLVGLSRQRFLVPDRSTLPPLESYAQFDTGTGERRLVGYTEATRGCKHLCRHCPIVPIYGGNFRVVQREVVLADIEQQVAAGARHVTFGDPDFFNGPGHALAIVRELHERFPWLTYDVTIKVEHLLKQRKHLPVLSETGCAFVTCAVEAVDDRILEVFDKNHTRAGFMEVARLFQELNLCLNPTFVTFNPWVTLEGYLDLVELLFELGLEENVAPIQWAIRLLIPEGSRLLELPEVLELIQPFDEEKLCYPWEHADHRVDELWKDVLGTVQERQASGATRREIAEEVWRLARARQDASVRRHLDLASLPAAPPRAAIPYLTEPWYC